MVVNFAARPARAGLAHRPEVVLVSEPDHPILRHAGNLDPEAASLVVGVVHRIDQTAGVDPVDVHQELMSKFDGALLEVIAKRKVPQHLEERVVARRPPHVVQIVVLAPGADTLLRAGRAGVGDAPLLGEHVLELVHPRVREQQGGIVGQDQRGARYLFVSLRSKVVEELPSNVVGSHVITQG
jgi:hypothetical protein